MTMFERLERLEQRVGALEASHTELNQHVVESVGSRLMVLDERLGGLERHCRHIVPPYVPEPPPVKRVPRSAEPWLPLSQCPECLALPGDEHSGTCPEYLALLRGPRQEDFHGLLAACFDRWEHDLVYNINDCRKDAQAILARARVAKGRP